MGVGSSLVPKEVKNIIQEGRIVVNIWLLLLMPTWAHSVTKDKYRKTVGGVSKSELPVMDERRVPQGAEGESSPSGVVCMLILQVHPSVEG